MFECDSCGLCCMNIYKSEIYSELDRGDGVCEYLSGNLCSIYENRPLLCRIDECYELFFKDTMSLEEYYRLNIEECEKLKKCEEWDYAITISFRSRCGNSWCSWS